jgi:peroxiredoxin Q/BCP
LLADHQAEVALRYHSLIDLGMFKFARRNTFLIDPQGNIAKIYLSANARRNANEVITDLKHIQATE